MGSSLKDKKPRTGQCHIYYHFRVKPHFIFVIQHCLLLSWTIKLFRVYIFILKMNINDNISRCNFTDVYRVVFASSML